MAWTNNLAQSGWIGVDFFFVLSGFLITKILLDAKRMPHYFTNFYMRRVLRIFPLYFGALTVVFVFLPVVNILSPADLGDVWSMQGWNWTYCTNIGMVFDEGSGFLCDYICFSHFWSLAVEEHFYLVWPAIIYITPEQYVKRVCIGCMGLAMAGRFVAVMIHDLPHVYFFLTPFRLDTLAMGGAIAASLKDGTLEDYRRWIYGTGVVTASALLIAFVYWRCLPARHWLNHLLGYTMYGAAFAAILVFALEARPTGFGERVLGNGVLVFFGKYSYGLYVIHGMLSPLIARWIPVDDWGSTLGSVVLGSICCTSARVGIVVVLAFLSWHLFEKHFLKLKAFFEYQRLPRYGGESLESINSVPVTANEGVAV
jgi:peptidoglycan/LPS O-acetylase OafA/YrhL